jgi:hypothetical protein
VPALGQDSQRQLLIDRIVLGQEDAGPLAVLVDRELRRPVLQGHRGIEGLR